MSTLKNMILSLCVLTSGCATCQEHPMACGIAYTVAVGSIIATANQHRHSENHPMATANIQPVNCANGVCK